MAVFFLSYLDMDHTAGTFTYRGFVLLDGEKLIDYDEYEFDEKVFPQILQFSRSDPKLLAVAGPVFPAQQA